MRRYALYRVPVLVNHYIVFSHLATRKQLNFLVFDFRKHQFQQHAVVHHRNTISKYSKNTESSSSKTKLLHLQLYFPLSPCSCLKQRWGSDVLSLWEWTRESPSQSDWRLCSSSPRDFLSQSVFFAPRHSHNCMTLWNKGVFSAWCDYAQLWTGCSC